MTVLGMVTAFVTEVVWTTVGYRVQYVVFTNKLVVISCTQ